MPHREIDTLQEEEIRARLERELPGWYYQDGRITRQYRTDGWPTTLMLVNHIGYLAEAADHHPNLTVGWAKVEVTLRTHHAKGITAKDFELAARIEESVLWRPGEGAALEGTQRKFVWGGEAKG